MVSQGEIFGITLKDFIVGTLMTAFARKNGCLDDDYEYIYDFENKSVALIIKDKIIEIEPTNFFMLHYLIEVSLGYTLLNVISDYAFDRTNNPGVTGNKIIEISNNYDHVYYRDTEGIYDNNFVDFFINGDPHDIYSLSTK